MKSDLKNSFVVAFLFISLFFIFFTNTYFTFDESLIYGASDTQRVFSKLKSKIIHSKRVVILSVLEN